MEKDSFTGRTRPALRTPSLARACVWSGVQVIVIGHHANGNCFHFRQSHYLQVHSHFSHIKTASPRDRKHSASYLHSRPSEGETNRFSLNSALASLYPQHLGGRVFGPPLCGGSPPATPPPLQKPVSSNFRRISSSTTHPGFRRPTCTQRVSPNGGRNEGWSRQTLYLAL